MLVAVALIFGLTPAIHASGLSGLEDSIKEGNISEENNATEAVSDETGKGNKADQIKKSSLAKSIKIKTQHPKNKFLKIVGDTFKKLKKLKTNPLSKLKQLNIPQILKKKKAATRISDVAKLKTPKRIEESENPPSNGSIIVPSPEKEFGFPLDKNDKIRVSGEVEVQRLYELACSTISKSPENDAIFQKMKEIANEIFKKYNAYPDLCAISKLYLVDAQARLGIEAEYSNGSASPMLQVEAVHRDFFKKYAQIMIDYAHESNKPNISKIIDFINKNRIEKILKNDENAQKAIAFYLDELEKNSAFLNEYINETAFYGENTDVYVSVVISTMNAIISDYSALHYYSVMTSDYESAEYLFKSEYQDGKLAFSGVIKDLYDSIPKEVPYHYVSGHDEQNNPIISTKMVEIYREPGRILEVVKSTRNAELLKYSQTFLDDENNTNLTQEKAKAISDWLKSYEPDREGKKGTPEKMSQADVDYLHDNAYGPNNYYKNTHIIKKIYFTRNENLEIIDDIPNPSDFINIRAEIEAASPDAPFYEYKIQIRNAKEPNRVKILTMKKDFNSVGYYAKFQPNETDDPKDNTKNLINNAKRGEYGFLYPKKTYISLYDMEIFDLPAFIFYSINKFFNENKQNSTGYATWYDREYNMGLDNYLSNNSPIDPAELKQKYTDNNIIKPSASFLKSAGMEYVQTYIENNSQKVKAQLALRNQADVFIVDCHGWDKGTYFGIKPNGGLIEAALPDPEGDVDKDKILVNLPLYDLIKKDGSSEYSENLKVLILLSCKCLDWQGNWQSQNPEDWIFAHGWYKVLPKGLILGYTTEPRGMITKNAIANFNLFFSQSTDKNLTFSSICQKWIEMNEKAYRIYVKNPEENIGYEGAEGASIIIGKKRFTFKPVRVSQGSLSLYKFMVNKPDNF